jgi:LysR family glycine cleavage system transcriptional activator
MRSLPPLNALRAFESAARTGSYVSAAEELGVSAAAISQQVKNLETYLGKQLFMRLNNRIVLTDAGKAIFPGTTEALQSIATVTQQAMTGATRQRLVISVLPSVAHRWMAPRLARYAEQDREFRFALRIEDDPVDFARHDIDLRVCYGTNLYPEFRSVQLCLDEVLPVCSPDYLTRNPAGHEPLLAGVPDEDLIHTDWGPSFGSHPGWQAWFALLDINRPRSGGGFRSGMSGLSLDLARDGVGVALGQRLLAADDISAGYLTALSDVAIPLGHAYSLVLPLSKERKTGLRQLVDWLVSEAR